MFVCLFVCCIVSQHPGAKISVSYSITCAQARLLQYRFEENELRVDLCLFLWHCFTVPLWLQHCTTNADRLSSKFAPKVNCKYNRQCRGLRGGLLNPLLTHTRGSQLAWVTSLTCRRPARLAPAAPPCPAAGCGCACCTRTALSTRCMSGGGRCTTGRCTKGTCLEWRRCENTTEAAPVPLAMHPSLACCFHDIIASKRNHQGN